MRLIEKQLLALIINRVKSSVNHLLLQEDSLLEQEATPFTKAQIENHRKVSEAIGLEIGPRKSFKEADSNRTNPKYSLIAEYFNLEAPYNINCTITVAVHEMRIRGWNVTAMPMNKNVTIMNKMLHRGQNLIWIDPKTGMPPQATLVQAKTLEKLKMIFEKKTSAVGRYHVAVNWQNSGGHIFCVDRLPDGNTRTYDPQNNELNIRDWWDNINLKKGVFVTKVDGLLINPKVAAQIVDIC